MNHHYERVLLQSILRAATHFIGMDVDEMSYPLQTNEFYASMGYEWKEFHQGVAVVMKYISNLFPSVSHPTDSSSIRVEGDRERSVEEVISPPQTDINLSNLESEESFIGLQCLDTLYDIIHPYCRIHDALQGDVSITTHNVSGDEFEIMMTQLRKVIKGVCTGLNLLWNSRDNEATFPSSQYNGSEARIEGEGFKPRKRSKFDYPAPIQWGEDEEYSEEENGVDVSSSLTVPLFCVQSREYPCSDYGLHKLTWNISGVATIQVDHYQRFMHLLTSSRDSSSGSTDGNTHSRIALVVELFIREMIPNALWIFHHVAYLYILSLQYSKPFDGSFNAFGSVLGQNNDNGSVLGQDNDNAYENDMNHNSNDSVSMGPELFDRLYVHVSTTHAMKNNYRTKATGVNVLQEIFRTLCGSSCVGFIYPLFNSAMVEQAVNEYNGANGTNRTTRVTNCTDASDPLTPCCVLLSSYSSSSDVLGSMWETMYLISLHAACIQFESRTMEY